MGEVEAKGMVNWVLRKEGSALEREYEKVTRVAVWPGGVKVHASASTTCTFCQPFSATFFFA